MKKKSANRFFKFFDTGVSTLFFAVGLFLVLFIYLRKHGGSYYTGGELVEYKDTLKQKIWATKGNKTSDRYHILLKHSPNHFTISNNAFDIVRDSADKHVKLTSIGVGEVVTVSYPKSFKTLVNDEYEKEIQIVGLQSSTNTILNPAEVQHADENNIRKWNMAGLILIGIGALFTVMRWVRRH